MTDEDAMLRWFELTFGSAVRLGQACGCTATATCRTRFGTEVTAIGPDHATAVRSLAALLDSRLAGAWAPRA